MKDAFTRFLFYLFMVIVVTGAVRASWPDAPVSDPIASKFAFYFINYGIGWTFWALVLLSVHQSALYFSRRRAENRDTAALDVPETNRLDRS